MNQARTVLDQLKLIILTLVEVNSARLAQFVNYLLLYQKYLFQLSAKFANLEDNISAVCEKLNYILDDQKNITNIDKKYRQVRSYITLCEITAIHCA